MNQIKFLTKDGKVKKVKVCQTAAGIHGLRFARAAGLSRRAAFILAMRKGWTHPKMASTSK